MVDRNGLATAYEVAKYIYTLGAGGERLKVQEKDRTTEYTYDKLNRLVKEVVTDGNDVYTTEYTYDSNSNRLTKTANGIVTRYTYNRLNQLILENDITYTYDANGNLVAKTSPTEYIYYIYDNQNRLIRAEVNGKIEQYTYDYAGNRTSKTTDGETVRYLLDTNCGLTQVLAELNADGTLKTYYTIGEERISLERTGETRYYLFDGHGSTRLLVDENCVVTDTYAYDAFGNLTSRTGETENNYLYCGEQFDGTTGLYYLRARYMNPLTGTFITMDSYQGSNYDPVSLHKYLYANANPVMFTDPSGNNAVSMAVSQTINGIMEKAKAAYDSVVVRVGMKLIADLRAYIAVHQCEILITGLLLEKTIFDIATGDAIPGSVATDVRDEVIDDALPFTNDDTTFIEKNEDAVPRSTYPPARRIKCKSRKEAYEKAKKAGKGKEPKHHPHDPKGPHFHPNVPNSQREYPNGPCSHDHYYY